MRYKIDQHDYDVRIGQASRFLKAGDKVKCTVIFRGREIQHTALAEVLLHRMARDLETAAEIQQPPKREGRNMIMFLTPRKAAVPKPGSASAAAKSATPKPVPVKAAPRVVTRTAESRSVETSASESSPAAPRPVDSSPAG